MLCSLTELSVCYVLYKSERVIVLFIGEYRKGENMEMGGFGFS